MSDYRRFAAELREDARTARAMAESLERRAAELVFLADAGEPADDAVTREAERLGAIQDAVGGVLYVPDVGATSLHDLIVGGRIAA